MARIKQGEVYAGTKTPIIVGEREFIVTIESPDGVLANPAELGQIATAILMAVAPPQPSQVDTEGDSETDAPETSQDG